MTIGIDAERANNPVKTGVEHYAKQLILHLAKIDHANKYILYLRTPPENWFAQLPSNFSVKILGYGPIPFPYLWTQLRLSWEMLWHAPDLLFIPAATMPLIHPRRSVYTSHDLGWIHYPEIFTWYMRQFHRVFSWIASHTAKRIIAISDATKRDLIKFYKLRPEKISVVPHGYEAEPKDFNKLSSEVAAQLPEKYVLFLSTLQPRKNVSLLIDAFRDLKTQHPELPHKLVIVGKAGWKFEQILRKIDENKDIVVYLKHISDDDRWPVYHRADTFIHPSLYEGFGMWILEAFECEVAVAVANNSSLPEVGGDAAVYFDPKSKQEIQDAMYKLLTNPELRAELIAKGKQRLPLYGWDRCAKETLAVFQEAYESK